MSLDTSLARFGRVRRFCLRQNPPHGSTMPEGMVEEINLCDRTFSVFCVVRRCIMLYPRTKVHQRRRQVTALLVRGVSPGEIAETLAVPPQTIYNDIRYIRSGRNPALAAYSRNQIVAQLYLNAQARARYLWDLAERADSEHVQLGTMRELRLNDERVVSKLLPVPTPKEAREADALSRYIDGSFSGLRAKIGLGGNGGHAARDGTTTPPGDTPQE
jgi:hypothetical protein